MRPQRLPVRQQKIKGAGGTIQQYREHGDVLRQEELAQALLQLQKGESAEKVLQEFSHRLTQKLLHPASILLREAAKAEDPEGLEVLQNSLSDVIEKRRKPKP